MLRCLRRFFFLLTIPVFQGCLYVELYGPVTGAQVTIAPLRGGVPLLENGRSRSLTSTQILFAEGQWEGFSDFERLALMGAVDVPKDQFDDDTYYLVTARGGLDWDYDQDGVLDNRGEEVLGDWHGIFTGAQLKRVTRLSVLSEAVYQEVLPDLENLDDAELARALDEATQRSVSDLDTDGVVNHSDLVRWSTIAHKDNFRGAAFWADRLRRDVELDLDDEVTAIDGMQLVERASWFPARPDGPYADLLLPCMSPVVFPDLCSMAEMPLLGQQISQASVEDVMNRVVVSHPWMSVRFKALLERMPPMVLTMMQSLTSIAIGDTIRPSYFTSFTNSMYLDADFVWLRAEELASISQEADFRSEFRSSVVFSSLWRYVLDGDSVGRSAYDVDANGNRTVDQLVPFTASLLFHELAHANDAIPSREFGSLDISLAPFQQNIPRIAEELTEASPLLSPELFGVAGVLFFGDTPTEAQSSYTAQQIGSFFESDRSNDLYSFSTQFEDLAMLIEEFMMAVYFGAERDLAFTPLPTTDDLRCDDYVISWGERNRITTPAVRERLEFVLARLFPDQDFSTLIDAIPDTTDLPSGLGWCEYLYGPPAFFAPLRKTGLRGYQEPMWLEQPFR